MAKNHQREPILPTCPTIDRYISRINSAIVQDRYLQNLNEKELLETASEMSAELENCIGYLEELRKSNEALRNWGIGEWRKPIELMN